jgi:hypothetical protein
LNFIQPIQVGLQTFIDRHSLQSLENYYSIDELETLIRIETDRERILSSDFSLQQILSYYFNSSKYTQTNSNLSKAIKTILQLEHFPEESKDLQFLSILYPVTKPRAIFICENLNRLRMPRHEWIEFWFAGGKNTEQLRYVPRTNLSMYYMCDWDHDGIGTYLHIKENYFASLNLFIPEDFLHLMTTQKDIKKHRSKWTQESNKLVPRLNGRASNIVQFLISTASIIEEQKISLTTEQIAYNLT